VEQRLSLITLGVADLPRARAFYEALGWRSPTDPADGVAFFQSGGMIVALWSRASLAEDSGAADGGGWGGVTLAHNVRSPAEVDAVLDEAERAGATIASWRGDVLGWLFGRIHRSRRASLGGCAQPRVRDRRRRFDLARLRNVGGAA
jgi:catechol 2,3-dioxygenase-like lactoylglutathione lyase family enzyme